MGGEPCCRCKRGPARRARVGALAALLLLVTALVPAGAEARWSYGTWTDKVDFSGMACGALATQIGAPNSDDRFLQNIAVITPLVGQAIYDARNPCQADGVVTKITATTA